MDSGILDFFYSRRLVPRETQKLADLVKSAIISRKFNVFTGPLYDAGGIIRLGDKKVASREEILSMDWLLEYIHGEIPKNTGHDFTTDLSAGKTTRFCVELPLPSLAGSAGGPGYFDERQYSSKLCCL